LFSKIYPEMPPLIRFMVGDKQKANSIEIIASLAPAGAELGLRLRLTNMMILQPNQRLGPKMNKLLSQLKLTITHFERPRNSYL
jgi:hypothetical protein